MRRKNLWTVVGSRARAAVVLIVVVVVLIGAFTLAYWDFELRFNAERKELAAVTLDAALGATVEPLDRATAESLGISPRNQGVVITSLGGNGPAARAGIRAGDVIERIGGIPVRSPDEAAEALKNARAPDINLTLNRRGQYAIIHLPIRTVPDRQDLAEQGAER